MMKAISAVILSMLFAGSLYAQGVSVSSFYGSYDASQKQMGKPSASLKAPVQELWESRAKAKARYKIGVLFPHLKDPYWLAVNYGIMDQAQKLGVSFELREAGGYTGFGKQRKQLKNFAKEGVDGIILASISYDKHNKEIARIVKSGIPVIELVNDIQAPSIQAKSLVSFFEMGYKAGEYVLKDSGGKDINIVFLPGPKGSGWADDSFAGFEKAIAENPGKYRKGKVHVFKPLYGDTGAKTQKFLIKRGMRLNQNIHYLVGNAVMAGVSTEVLKTLKKSSVKVVSTYLIPDVYAQIKAGTVAAAPTDLMLAQGRIAIDMMVNLLEGKKAGVDFPFRSGPVIPVISQENLKNYSYERLFGPQNFKATFKG